MPAQWIFFISLIEGLLYWEVGSCFDWVFTPVYQCSLCRWLWEQLHSLLAAITISSSNTVQEKYWSTNLIYCQAAKIITENIGLIIPCSKYFGIVANNLDSLKTLLGLRRPILSVGSLKRPGRHNDYLSNVLLNQALQPRNLQEFRCPHLNSVP